MSGPVIVGIDPSLTGTGLATIHDGTAITTVVATRRLDGHDRLQHILRSVFAATQYADLVGMEGPSFGSTGSAVHQIAGLWWLIAHGLWERQTPLAIITPSVAKKYVTGKGTAKKDQVLVSVVRRFPAVNVADNNAADALVMAAIVADQVGCPLAPMPAVQRAVLANVDWPAPFRQPAVPA